MAEKITIQPGKIRAYGNIVNNKTVEDYDRYESSLVKSLVTINGVPISAYLLVYSPNNFAFDFDGNLKHLYVSEDEETVDGFTFDNTNKRLSFTSDDVSFGFDDTNKRLYCDNEYHPTSYSVSLNVSSSSVSVGGSVTLSATVLDDQETAVEGATVTFKVGGSTIDTATTNSSGVATLSYTCNTAGSLSFTASCNGANSTSQSVTVNKLSTSTALTTSSGSVTVGTSVTFTATVTSGGSGVNGLTVTFKDGTSTLGTGTTNSSGVATYTTDALTEGTHSITAVVTETSTYSTSTSTAVTVTVSSAPSYLFYDDCSSSSGLTNYGASQLVRGSTATITMTYDSTENAYKLSGSGNYHAMIPITSLANQDNYTISMDCKGQAIRYNMVGFFLDNSADTTSYGLAFGLDIGKADNGTNQSLYSRLYRVNGDGTGYITYLDSNVLTADKYYNLRFTVNGNTLTGALYDGTTKLAEKTVTYTINNKSMGILLFCEKGTTQSACYVKNIKAEAL